MPRLRAGWLSLLGAAYPALTAAQSCPNVDAMSGYPLAVAAVDTLSMDRAFLVDFARALAYRWVVPSRRRSDYSSWQRVSRRLLPPEPRWADDWHPSERHRAQMLISVYRNRPARAHDPALKSGDRLFDQSLRSMVEGPLPGSPALPQLTPGYPGDSAVLNLTIGFIDSTVANGAVVRFAAEQSSVRLQPGSLRVEAPRGPGTPSSSARRATVKYDVTTAGIVDMGSFEVLETSDNDLAQAIRDGLARAHFSPAESNCRPIAHTVVQTFGP